MMHLHTGRVVLLMLFFAALAACPFHGQAQGFDELLQSARSAQARGDYTGAAKLYERATALAPDSPELWANRGIVEYLADQFDASAVSLRYSLQLNPSLFVPMLFLGKVYVQTGKPALALPYLNHAHSLRPKDVEVLLALGKADALLNQQRQAASFYIDAARIAPENAEAWLGLGSASLDVITIDGRVLAAIAAQSAWARSLYADELFAQGRPLEAEDTYKASLAAASPAQKSTLILNLQWMQSHPDLFPMPPDSQKTVQQLSAQFQNAQGNAASPPCSNKVSLLEDTGCAFWSGDYERSASDAGELLRETPQSAEALYWSIKANERVAVAALSRYEDLAPHSSTTYAMVGDLYRYQRQMDNALSEYRKALAIDAHDPAALMGTAATDLATNNLDEAAAADRIALADRPLDPQLNLLMAEVLAAKNQYEQARPYLEKCLSAPREMQSRVHYLLGRASQEDGETAEAIHQFEMALNGDKDGSAHYQLSRLYRRIGKVAEAQQTEAEAKALIGRRDAHATIAVREAKGTNP